MDDEVYLHLEHDGKILLVDQNGNGPQNPIPGRTENGPNGWLLRLPSEDEARVMGLEWEVKRTNRMDDGKISMSLDMELLVLNGLQTGHGKTM